MDIGKHIKKITIDSKAYPEALRKIKNPPRQLYIIGNERILNSESVAIIGSRSATEIGKDRARKWSNTLSSQGITIISGMAKGIDTQAHIGAIETKGNTIAVMGTGFGTIFPKENENLFNKIIKQNGAIVTEYDYNIGISSHQFIERNRIVSGLAKAVLIIEAKYRSGTTTTASFAKREGRKIFCIPHDIDDKSGYGTNYLIKKRCRTCEFTK